MGKLLDLLTWVEMDAEIVLIVSAKADVKGEWKKTVESHIKFDGFSFLDSNSLLQSDTIIKEKIEANEKNCFISRKMEEMKKNGITYTFSELLKPKSILKDKTSYLHKKFIYEQEIINQIKQ